jgi:hypothetical protein
MRWELEATLLQQLDPPERRLLEPQIRHHHLDHPRCAKLGQPRLQHLRRHRRSGFTTAAHLIFEDKHIPSAPLSLRRLAGILEDWATYVEEGLADVVGPDARARLDASTDLMEQVQQLLDDGKVHPAAPIMLAGAALEELLRSLVITPPPRSRASPACRHIARHSAPLAPSRLRTSRTSHRGPGSGTKQRAGSSMTCRESAQS